LAVLPYPYSATEHDASYGYQLSIVQAEFSSLRILAAPVSGQILYDNAICDNPYNGRADRVSLIFERSIHGNPRHRHRRFLTLPRPIPAHRADQLNRPFKNAEHGDRIALDILARTGSLVADQRTDRLTTKPNRPQLTRIRGSTRSAC
jgi:hypothetical protein